MAENEVEQPGATSAPETVTEAPEVEATPEAPVAEKPRESSIPRQRFDEVYSRMQRAEQAAEQHRELLSQVLTNYPGSASSPVEEESDPGASVLKKLQPHLQQIQSQVFSLRDERDREAFWRDNDMISEDIQSEVESMLGGFRKQGLTDIRREDLLAHAIGKRQLPELKKKARAPVSAPPPVNRVAHAEGGSTARSNTKRIEDMTPAEVDALPSEVLFEYLKGKPF